MEVNGELSHCSLIFMVNACVCVVPRFLLKDGQLWLCAPQAKQIWKCLAENAVFLCDREACFKWYAAIINIITSKG